MNADFYETITNECSQLGITLNEDQIYKFYRYYELLVEWNKVMNLTAITEEKEVITKHFVDSISIILAIENIEKNDFRIIDIGTGAGFPGIPLKIVFPNLEIVLLDSLNKRVVFLNHVIEELKLSNISALHGRAEDFGRNENHREQYDICVSRAVANLSTLSEYCLPFVKIGGYFVSYKSAEIEEELQLSTKAISRLGGKLAEKKLFRLPGKEIERSLIVIEKNRKTSNSFPRKSGLPSKEPMR